MLHRALLASILVKWSHALDLGGIVYRCGDTHTTTVPNADTREPRLWA